ncbi:transcription elongation factor subunit Spt4 [Methanocaldococcus infernus]|uniref:Transcription elongation factor Spt4 n=1 Tax=Methanocaldococcus infernus (strain DSM 11812 / JCM 15783 / ME) TaxID=573063 RepID=D5VT17_METIM|nr:transcription elongation factor subunit Spt4 [Methanocaldococcus infernus]ADG13720.1 DNA-directed RNA polymerase subunit E, RpoE2 [Methanocaldococcus infernus ME]
MRACIKCKYLTEEKECPICKSPTSEKWIGLLIILDPEKSEIAKLLGIKVKGKYAISVKE